MIRLQVNPAYSDLLKAHRLDSYADVMRCDAGEPVEDNAERDVRRLQLGGQVVYLKRTRYEKARSAFESYARGRLAHSKPFREMLQFKYLASAGFDVAEVVACGEQLRYAIPRRGFIITAEVPGEDLAQVYRSASVGERREILAKFGLLLGRLHDRGFYGSTRLKDIIYSGASSSRATLTLIDRETRNPYPRRATRKRIVARLLFNIRRQAQQGEIFNEREWTAFSERYCASLSRDFDLRARELRGQILDMLSERGWLRTSS